MGRKPFIAPPRALYFSENLFNYLEEKNIPGTHFAQKVGMEKSAFCRILNAKVWPAFPTLLLILDNVPYGFDDMTSEPEQFKKTMAFWKEKAPLAPHIQKF